MRLDSRFLFLAGFGAFIWLAAPAGAQEQCAAGCGQAKAACVKSARLTKLACKVDCRTNAAPADLGGCLRDCTDAFRATVIGSCRDDLGSCIGTCNLTTADASGSNSEAAACRGVCGGTLGECARQVAAGIRACVAGCGTAPDRLPCLQSCETTAQSGAENCATTFETCVEDCGGPTPPPTPTTTLPSVPSCQSAEAPTCGGSCPNAAQQCVAVTADRCACVGGSPE